jgi:hypothetical protein
LSIFARSAAQSIGAPSRADGPSPAAVLDLPELSGRTLVLASDNEAASPSQAEPDLDRRQLRHVGMILQLAEVEGGQQ